MTGDWFEREEFWETFRPVLFGPERWLGTSAAVDKLLERIPLPPGARVLDLCCGPGRHALELTRRGYAVTGVDRTAIYLDEARRRAADEGLAIEFVKEDMRRFRRPLAFDAALNLFTSFGYFDDPADDLRVAENLCASLKPGAPLVMDTLSKEILARNYRERDWDWVDREAGVIMLEERSLSDDWNRIRNVWTLITPTERHVQEFTLRLYAGSELTALLLRAGFATVRLFGGLDGTPYDHQARRLVAVAEKGI